MKELQSATCNITALPKEDGGFTPLIEAILIVSEPRYTLDEAGHQIKSRIVETMRFSSSPKGLRTLAKIFEEWATGAEETIDKAMEAISDKPQEVK